MSHAGIVLRVSVGGAVVLEATSVELNLIAQLSGAGDGWYDPFKPVNGPFTATVVHTSAGEVMVPVPINLEIRAVQLSDPVDYEESDATDTGEDQEAQADHG